jgi:hypothetical protein
MRCFLPAALAAALLVPHAPAQSPPAHTLTLNIGGLKLTPEQCARRAVEAMGTKQKFLYAGTAGEGRAWGWNETTTVVVMAFPQPVEGFVHAVVLAAGTDPKEVERLRNSVAEYVAGGAPDPATPEVICSPDLGLKRSTAPCVDWQVQPRDAVSTVKFFQPVAGLMFEKRGCQHNNIGPNVALGGNQQGVSALFVLPGSSAVKLHFAAVTFCTEEDDCKRIGNHLLSAVIKTIYE